MAATYSMALTYVPDPTRADGQLGTGSNLVPVADQEMAPTYVPSPYKADGQDTLTAPVLTGDSPFDGSIGWTYDLSRRRPDYWRIEYSADGLTRWTLEATVAGASAAHTQ